VPAQERLKRFMARMNKGENFADLAREYSDHPSAAQGGLVDPQAALPFIEDCRKLRRSQFSDPQSDDSGLHLYFRDRDAALVPFEQVREQVAIKAAAAMTAKALADLLADLRSRATITYRK
jgi:parvulin-like peptidyl-prolyl isomerase